MRCWRSRSLSASATEGGILNLGHVDTAVLGHCDTDIKVPGVKAFGEDLKPFLGIKK
jgi:hypothetical protein